MISKENKLGYSRDKITLFYLEKYFGVCWTGVEKYP